MNYEATYYFNFNQKKISWQLSLSSGNVNEYCAHGCIYSYFLQNLIKWEKENLTLAPIKRIIKF